MHCRCPHSVRRNGWCFRQVGMGQVRQKSHRGKRGDNQLPAIQTVLPGCYHLPRQHRQENGWRGASYKVQVSF